MSLALWTRAGNGRSQAQLTSGLGLHIHGRWPPGVLTRNTGWEVSSYWRVRPEMADRRDAGLPKLTRRDRGADFPPAREPPRDSPAGWGRSARAGRRGPFRTECRAPLASALGIGPLSRPVARFATPGLGHQEDGSEPPSPPMRAEVPDRAKLHHGKSHCTLAPGPPPRCLLSPMPFPAPAPSSRGVGSRRPSGTAPSQCGCGWL